MQATDNFKHVIDLYLKGRAEEDTLFAETLKKENKNLDECIRYILLEVKNAKKNAYLEEEIYNLAVHYYDEDDIVVDGVVGSCQIVMNDKHTASLPKPKPFIPPTYKAPTPVKVEPKKMINQLNLFDGL